MEKVTLIFPHQLFRSHPALAPGATVYLVEESLFYTQYHFHKKKLMLHRASMMYYRHYLQGLGFRVEYIEASDPRADVRELVSELAKNGIKEIQAVDPVDDWLKRRLEMACGKNGVVCILKTTPSFINAMNEVDDWFNKRRSYFQTDFYTWQRKKRRLLVDTAGQPLGGKWSFDAENREKLPKGLKLPSLQWFGHNNHVREAREYVEKQFFSNPGTTEYFGYPSTFEEADEFLEKFLEQRFRNFGIYEDAMHPTHNFLFHSLLSSSLNCGLLEPLPLLERAIAYASENNIPLNSLEGFVRQILGWREFIRIVYEREGRKQRTANHFGFKRSIPSSFWKGTTGIEPVDNVILHTLRDGYTHHINRLMVMGNFMLLCEFDPDQVYLWFMEMYVDAYDWVMVPNVYGMTQFADGGLMVTKPYISGSNYLMKMGTWNKGRWQQVWDALFWRFMNVQRDLMGRNPRLSMLVKTFDKMDQDKKSKLMNAAEEYLQSLDKQQAYA